MAYELVNRLASFRENASLIFNGKVFTYHELIEAIEIWKSLLFECGIRSGSVVALEGTYSFEMVAALLATFACQAVAVPLTPLPDKKRSEFFEVAEIEWVVRIKDDVISRVQRENRKASHALYKELWSRNVPGLLIFSSGTTGRAKASLLDVSKLTKRYSNSSRPKRILAFLNLDHIGGINTLLHTINSGGAIITTLSRTPKDVFAAIEQNNVNVLPTTPTFLIWF